MCSENNKNLSAEDKTTLELLKDNPCYVFDYLREDIFDNYNINSQMWEATYNAIVSLQKSV